MTVNTEDLSRQVGRLAEMVAGTRAIRIGALGELAAAFDCPIREAELVALESGVVPMRYIRNIGTIGLDGQAGLLRATVAVVGLGGLGGYVAEALTRMGVGHLVLIDADAFEDHNLNRQILSAEGCLGVNKTEIAEQRIAAINSAVEVTSHPVMLTAENLPDLLAEVEVVVDALDRLPIRLALQEGAQALGIPMVHGAIAGFMGQVMTIFPNDAGLRSLYGEEGKLPEQGLEAELGTPAATPMAVAAWQAQEVVRILTGNGEPLRMKLLVMDMETCKIDSLALD